MTTPLSEMLLAVGINHSTMARLKLAQGGAMRFERSNRGWFHLVLGGAVTIRCGNRALRLREGDYAALVRGTAHRLDLDDPQAVAAPGLGDEDRLVPPVSLGHGRGQAVIISGQYGMSYPGRARIAFNTPDPLVLRGGARQGERYLGGLVPAASLDEASIEGNGAKALLASLVQFLHVKLVLDHVAEMVVPQTATPRAMGMAEFDSVVGLIRNQPEAAWTLGTLARAVGMSRSTLSERFSATTGESPIAHLTKVRMEKAAHLLEHTRQPLGHIAVASGYISQSAFSRAFRRRFAVTPGAYRRGERQGV